MQIPFVVTMDAKAIDAFKKMVTLVRLKKIYQIMNASGRLGSQNERKGRKQEYGTNRHVHPIALALVERQTDGIYIHNIMSFYGHAGHDSIFITFEGSGRPSHR